MVINTSRARPSFMPCSVSRRRLEKRVGRFCAVTTSEGTVTIEQGRHREFAAANERGSYNSIPGNKGRARNEEPLTGGITNALVSREWNKHADTAPEMEMFGRGAAGWSSAEQRAGAPSVLAIESDPRLSIVPRLLYAHIARGFASPRIDVLRD